MNIVLLNDTTMKAAFEKEHSVLAIGMKDAPYPMPDQDHFDYLFTPAPILPIEEIVSLLPPDFTPDLLIHYETHNNFFYTGIEELPYPVIWRTIDNHLHGGWQPRYSSFYDLTLVAQKDFLNSFRENGNRSAEWLPLCAFPQVHYDRNLERRIDVAFVGDMNPDLKPERVAFLTELQELLPYDISLFSGLNQEEISELYNRSKIVINEVMAGDLNYRVFEAIADGALVLTPEIENGQPELLRDSVVTYENRNAKDAAVQIETILQNWELYSTKASEAQTMIHRSHTIELRAKEILELYDSIVKDEFAQRKAKITVDTYISIIPVFASLFSMNYCGFEGVEYALQKIESYGAGFARQVAAHYYESFTNAGSTRLASAFAQYR